MPEPASAVPSPATAGRFDVELPLELTSELLTAAVARGLAGREVGPTPFTVRVGRIEVDLVPDTLRITVALAGACAGTVELTGVPRLDETSGDIQLREVRVAFPGRVWGLGAVVRALRVPLEALVNRELRRAGAEGLARAREEVGELLRGKGAPTGIGVAGELADLRIRSVEARAGVLRLWVSCSGSVAVRVVALPGAA